jgi:hypothetical protein
MGNPDQERTTINVKGVLVSAWETAKKAANKQNETMGSWLSRAIPHLANLEAGPREFPPVNPEPNSANPSPAAYVGPPIDVLMAIVALSQEVRESAHAAGIDYPKSAARRHSAILRSAQLAVLGKPTRAQPRTLIGLASGQSLLKNGKAYTLAANTVESTDPVT